MQFCYNPYVFFGLPMGKTILKILQVGLASVLLAGCVVVINTDKPTADEQTLLNIQTQASQEIAQINQKIQTGNYSVEQIQQLINQANAVVQQNLKKIDDLNIPARTRDLEEKTKEYLQKAQDTYRAFLQMSQQTADQKVQDLIQNLQTMTQPLLNMSKQIQDMQNQFLSELQKAAGTSPGVSVTQQTP